MSYVENPEAIGNPDEEPIVVLSADHIAAFKAMGVLCDCGGMNGYHAEDCTVVRPVRRFNIETDEPQF